MSLSSSITALETTASVSDFSAPSAGMGFDAPDMMDINLFNSELATTSRDAPSATHNAFHDMPSYLDTFQKSSESFNSSLLKVSKDPTASNMIESMHEVSNFDLQARLMTKIVSSGVKAVDKLTSMQ